MPSHEMPAPSNPAPSNPAPSSPAALPAAAIVHETHGQADWLLHDLARQLTGAGHAIAGVLQLPASALDAACASEMVLIDLSGHQRYAISQSLGSGSDSCCLDESGVAAAAQALRQAVQTRPPLVLVNRFGKLEAQGSGFHAEFLALLEAGIPLLTAVRAEHLPAWRAFTGGAAAELPPEAGAIARWCEEILRARSPS